MAGAATRSRAGRRRLASRFSPRAKLLPLASASLRAYRLPLLGVATVLAVAAITNWLTAPVDLLPSLRDGLVEALGLGVFLVVAALLLAALWLLAGAPTPGWPVLRRLTGAVLWALFALGIAGLFRPAWDVGDVDLAATTVGGDVGDRLSSPLGAVIMLALALSAALLTAPSLTLRGLGATLGGTAAGIGAITAATARAVRSAHLRPPMLSLRLPGRSRHDPWDHSTRHDATAAADADDADAIGLTEDDDADLFEADDDLAEEDGADSDEPDEMALPPAVDGRTSAGGWELPPLSLLNPDHAPRNRRDSERLARTIIETLASFGVDAAVTQINQGPAVTQFGVEPGWEVKTKLVSLRDETGRPLLDDSGRPLQREEEVGRTRVRVSKITRLANDLALALAAPSIRVEAPVPGRSVIGIEVPTADRRLVALRDVIESAECQKALRNGGLPIALGRAVSGKPVVRDLTRMPHLLIAGATGSGKSVCINSIIACLLMHFSPQELRLVLIDPKRVELTDYAAVPHLAFSRVITDADEVVTVLAAMLTEMERRYLLFQRTGARNVAAYNAAGHPSGKLPFWVVVVDELADLMMAAPAEVEQQLVRLAQLARATGIHLVIATQRPSVDVVTGLIKANFPTRLAFATSSATDSRVIIDHGGAEKLLGRGDMLFVSSEGHALQRVQGTYVSDDEIAALIDFWTDERFRHIPRPTLDHLLQEAATKQDGESSEAELPADAPSPGERDTLYPRALALARDHSRVSASLLQRRLRVGYPRAARLIDELEAEGVVAPAEGGQSRPVLAPETTVESR